MFVPVSCTNCGKPFQVPESALGQLAPCPWCGATVAALPVSAPVAPPQPPPPAAAQQPQPQQEPFSLDDEPEAPPGRAQPGRSQGAPAPERKPRPAAPAAADGKRFVGFWLMLALGLAVALSASLLTVAALKRKSGLFVSADWKTFTTPDGSCTVDLLGTPAEDADATAGGGRRYTSEGWYSGAKAWVGWKDLTRAEASLATTLAEAEKATKEWERLHPNDPQRVGAPPQPQGWHLFRASLFNPEIERLKSTFGGYVVKDATIRFDPPMTVEVRLETPHGPLVERIIIKADGPHPRAYFVGMVGKRLAPDGPELEHLFSSFRIND
jgi:hypothetical protein